MGVRVWAELVWLRGLWMVRGSPVSELTKVVDARGEGEVWRGDGGVPGIPNPPPPSSLLSGREGAGDMGLLAPSIDDLLTRYLVS